jgi:D-alanyl-D-alanine endopeptidase (penicillin-binding protein 7)
MSMVKIVVAAAIASIFTIPAFAHGRHHHRYTPSKPVFSTRSFLVADETGQIIKEQDSDTVRPIASISKLMLALLVSDQDLSERIEIPKTRTVHSSIPQSVHFLTRRELLTLALVKSDNFAAQILCNNLNDCIDRMNSKANELGMANTHYVEPTGLSKENVSTARDLLKLIQAAAGKEIIGEISRMPNAEIVAENKKIHVNNTNPLTARIAVLLSKTGFTNPAGGCLLMIVQTEIGRRIVILLGSKNTHTRIPDAERLIKDVG